MAPTNKNKKKKEQNAPIIDKVSIQYKDAQAMPLTVLAAAAFKPLLLNEMSSLPSALFVSSNLTSRVMANH